jgi:hypothetical protein
MPLGTLNKTILLITVVITAAVFFFVGSRKWSMHGDALGYYTYLPATFIYHNIKALDSLPANRGIDHHVMEYADNLKLHRTPKGYPLNQYTYGIAFMEMPFFFAVTICQKIGGMEANGYSDVYNLMLLFCSLFYAVAGLILTFSILKKIFNERQSFLGTIAVFMGTNLFYFSTIQGGMAHPILFFLYALLIYLTIRLHEQPKYHFFLLAGMTAGMITIIRPTDILCLLIPLFYNVYNKATIREKRVFIRAHGMKIIVFTVMFAVPIIPQLLYWKWTAGSFFYYSYGSQSFDFRHPKIIGGLFYYSNGWLPYALIMIFSLIGLLICKPIKKWIWVLCSFIPIYIYVIYSWYCFNYINGLGSRPMINIYALLALPLTSFIQLMDRQHKILKFFWSCLCVFFVAVNINYSLQQSKGILLSEESNMAFNWQMLFRSHLNYNDLVTHDVGERQPDPDKLTKIGTLECRNFNDSTSDHFARNVAGQSNFVYRMRDQEFQEGAHITYDKRQFKDAKWFKCSGKFLYPECPGYYKHVLVLDVSNKKWIGCTINNKISGPDPDFYRRNDVLLGYCDPNKWGYVYYFVRIPSNIKDGDVVKLFLWSSAKADAYIEFMCLEVYK